MIIKCPNCLAALNFDENSQKVVCEYCETAFDVKDVIVKEEKMNKLDTQELIDSGYDVDDAYMGLNVYTCTSCGGEIQVNGVEASTFCSFCGQPTVIFDRVQKNLKPKYILPFIVSKEKAEKSVREQIAKSFFATKEIKAFQTECMRGIYIPFWLMDVHYDTSMVLKGSHKSGKNTVTSYYYRKAHTNFNKITLDASQQLADESSQRLEPYHLDDLKDFHIGYLTGFYADSLDLQAEQLDTLARSRARALAYKEIEKSVPESNISVIREKTDVKVTKAQYALLPVWFLSFHNREKPYTYLINGQTGKIIGAVEHDNAKKIVSMIIAFLVLVVPSALLCMLFLEGEDAMKALFLEIGGIVALTLMGMGFSSSTRKNLELTQSKNMFNLVKKRQGKK
ncbi:MAG: hypothetical protein KBT48_10610 [Firmicutes bacterium]|nr:hypothetical protein [Bacillota bacterium]